MGVWGILFIVGIPTAIGLWAAWPIAGAWFLTVFSFLDWASKRGEAERAAMTPDERAEWDNDRAW